MLACAPVQPAGRTSQPTNQPAEREFKMHIITIVIMIDEEKADDEKGEKEEEEPKMYMQEDTLKKKACQGRQQLSKRASRWPRVKTH